MNCCVLLNVCLENPDPTMRSAYWVLAFQYDPLIILISYTTRAKILLQCLWSKMRRPIAPRSLDPVVVHQAVWNTLHQNTHHTILGAQTINGELLRTILIEVESIINSKPLGYISGCCWCRSSHPCWWVGLIQQPHRSIQTQRSSSAAGGDIAMS